jgi:hypothetical protein
VKRKLAAGLVLAACAPRSPPPLSPDEPAPETSTGSLIDEGARRATMAIVPWKPSPAQKWLPALESTQPPLIEERRLLAPMQKDYVGWLGMLHDRIHPIFAEHFLESLKLEPEDSPLADAALVTRVHFVVGGFDGRIRAIRVAKGSGLVRFDVGALDALDRAQPFPQAPIALRSSDGGVYVQWDFYRNPMRGCSLENATPAHR